MLVSVPCSLELVLCSVCSKFICRPTSSGHKLLTEFTSVAKHIREHRPEDDAFRLFLISLNSSKILYHKAKLGSGHDTLSV